MIEDDVLQGPPPMISIRVMGMKVALDIEMETTIRDSRAQYTLICFYAVHLIEVEAGRSSSGGSVSRSTLAAYQMS